MYCGYCILNMSVILALSGRWASDWFALYALSRRGLLSFPVHMAFQEVIIFMSGSMPYLSSKEDDFRNRRRRSFIIFLSIAALHTGRRSFAAEVNPDYFQVAASRLEEEFNSMEERREHVA